MLGQDGCFPWSSVTGHLFRDFHHTSGGLVSEGGEHGKYGRKVRGKVFVGERRGFHFTMGIPSFGHEGGDSIETLFYSKRNMV